MAYEKKQVLTWVQEQFGEAWASECSVAFARQPISCFIATAQQTMLGFCCYEVTQKNFFGPLGVAPDHHHRGIGSALLIRALQAMREMGYAYAIVGGGQALAFYQKSAGAIIIEGSEKGIYSDRLGKA